MVLFSTSWYVTRYALAGHSVRLGMQYVYALTVT